jgi:succinyl-CoA synthetase beta subunit
MKLFEFEAKNILKQYGIVIPQGKIASKPAEAKAIAQAIGKPAVVKSQILVSGRGKAGGIVFVSNGTEARDAAAKLLGSNVKGCVVERLLVEERLDIAAQCYASLTIDRQARTYIALASTSGGVDIEEVAQTSPEKIARYQINISTGFSKKDATEMLSQFNLDKGDVSALAESLSTLYTVAMDYDAELVELNPLVKTLSGRFAAADARIIVDDNAAFRHPELVARDSLAIEDSPREIEAKKQKLAYLDLDGDIGIVGNGAGLVMATIDMVRLAGGKPGNFLDLGGGGQAEKTKLGIMLVMSKPEIKAILVNILGGITRCDLVAEAIVQALNESTSKKPLAIRMSGTNEDEAAHILRQAGINSYRGMDEAVKDVVKLGGQSV